MPLNERIHFKRNNDKPTKALYEKSCITVHIHIIT